MPKIVSVIFIKERKFCSLLFILCTGKANMKQMDWESQILYQKSKRKDLKSIRKQYTILFNQYFPAFYLKGHLVKIYKSYNPTLIFLRNICTWSLVLNEDKTNKVIEKHKMYKNAENHKFMILKKIDAKTVI